MGALKTLMDQKIREARTERNSPSPEQEDEPTTVGVLIDNPEAEEGPEQSEKDMSVTECVTLTGAEQEEATRLFDKIVEAARWKLFHGALSDTERPTGDDTGYVCPAYRWLPLVGEAVAKLKEAEVCALKEIPKSIDRELRAAAYRGDGMVTQLKRGDPEVRRLALIGTAVAFLGEVMTNLANEGRPRPLRFFEKPEFHPARRPPQGFEHLRPDAILRESRLMKKET